MIIINGRPYNFKIECNNSCVPNNSKDEYHFIDFMLFKKYLLSFCYWITIA